MQTRTVLAGLGWALLGLVGLLLLPAPPWMRLEAQAPGSVRTGAITADEGTVLLDTSTAGAAAIQLTGTWVATVEFEGSVDGGTFVALNLIPSNSATAASSATATGAWNANIGGYRLVRARASAFTSGTIEVTLSSAGSGGKGGG